MGLRKILRRVVAFLIVAAIAAGVLFSFRYNPLIKRTIDPDGICGPFDEVFKYEDWFQVTADGESCFYGAEYKGKYFIISPATIYGPFDGIVPFKTTAKSASWGFAGQTGDCIVVIINGETRFEIHDGGRIFNPEYRFCLCHDVISRNEKITLSPDGARWTFKVFRDDGEYAIVNGEEFGPYEKIYYVRISPEGSNWGAVVAIGSYEYVLINGKKYGPFHPAGDLDRKYPHTHAEIGFTKKGNAWAAYGGRYTRSEKLIVNGALYGPYDNLDCFRWSDAGDVWCFNYRKGKAVFLVFNGMQWGPFLQKGFEMWPQGNVSNDGDSWAVAFNGADGANVILNGRNYGPYERASIPVFSEGGEHWAFWFGKNSLAYAVIDGNEEGPYESIRPPFLEGSSYAYWMKRNGSWYVVVNGVEWGPYSESILAETFESYIKLSGPNWAICDETDERVSVVINGKAFGPYDLAFSHDNLEFTEDGSAWVYRVQKGDGETYAVLNGVEYGPFSLRSVKLFSSGDRVGFCALEELPDKKYRLLKKTSP